MELSAEHEVPDLLTFMANFWSGNTHDRNEMGTEESEQSTPVENERDTDECSSTGSAEEPVASVPSGERVGESCTERQPGGGRVNTPAGPGRHGSCNDAGIAVNMPAGVALEEEYSSELVVQFDHLHQLFVTKNPVLCHEVEKNFNRLSHSYAHILDEHIRAEIAPVPFKFQHAHPSGFPFFLTLREFLIILGFYAPFHSEINLFNFSQLLANSN